MEQNYKRLMNGADYAIVTIAAGAPPFPITVL